MNLHEYQAKRLLADFGLDIPLGVCLENKATDNVDEALEVFRSQDNVVVKAQIHAGGRGKGIFVENGRHGVQVVSLDQTKQAVDSMFNNTLITQQTGKEGKKVRRVYLTEAISVEKEFYVSILIDRSQQCPTLIVSSEGGCEIEEVAQKNPNAILKISIDPLLGLRLFQARKVCYLLGLEGELAQKCIYTLLQLYQAFVKTDASLIEINPLVSTKDGRICLLDAKVQLDDNALFRHPECAAWDDPHEKDPKEVEAGNAKLNYVALNGNIACLVNGAGLAMATMDIIQHFGGKPANFLDVGGGAQQEQIETAFRIILKDSNVKGIFINIFGGILKCDMLAHGVVNAARSVQLKLPLVIRMKGTNVEQGKQILMDSGLPLIPIDDLALAAQTIVDKVK